MGGGGSKTKNEIVSSINLSMDILTKTIQNCGTFMTSNQVLRVSGDYNRIYHTSFKDVMSLNVSCLQTAKVTNEVASQISNEMSQSAKSIIGSLNVGGGTAEADNITKNFIKLGTAIQNTFNQDCIQNIQHLQELDVSGNHNNLKYQSFSAMAEVVKNCVQNSDAVNKATAAIENSVDQKAHAEKKGLLDGLGMIILIIIVVVGGVVLTGGKAATNPKFIMAALAAVAAYMGFAYWKKKWPFTEDEDKKDGKHTEEKSNTTQTGAGEHTGDVSHAGGAAPKESYYMAGVQYLPDAPGNAYNLTNTGTPASKISKFCSLDEPTTCYSGV